MKISKETQVGALTAIAITILVLGYSYLNGKDDLFYNGQSYNVVYGNVDGLTSSNPVMFRGVRIGIVSEVFLDVNTLETHVALEVNKRGFRVPKGTIAKIFDTDPLFGAKGIELILGKSAKDHVSGDTLKPEFSLGMMSSVGNTLAPLTTKLNNILGALDTATSGGELEKSLKELPSTITALKTTLNNTNRMVSDASPKLNSIFANVDALVKSLSENKEVLSNTLKNFESISDDLAKSKLEETISNANVAISEFSKTIDGINQGKGSLGKLAKDEELYNNLNKASKDLDLLLLDIKNYPDKYLSIPGTKRRQRKAIEESNNSTRD
jgi:phospholipid/cholesterol/gamma-HCH transport system substrate-binding protein